MCLIQAPEDVEDNYGIELIPHGLQAVQPAGPELDTGKQRLHDCPVWHQQCQQKIYPTQTIFFFTTLYPKN